MAPLSREVTGVVLLHDSFTTYLDSNSRTVDVNLEKDDFNKTEEILASVSSVYIDGHEVVAKYIDPNNDALSVSDLPAGGWYSEHVRDSQYLLQVRDNLFKFNNALFSFHVNYHIFFSPQFHKRLFIIF